MKRRITLEFDDYKITYDDGFLNAEFLYKSINKKININYRVLDNGELFYNFREFNNGFFFLDNKRNFFIQNMDVIIKKIFVLKEKIIKFLI